MIADFALFDYNHPYNHKTIELRTKSERTGT